MAKPKTITETKIEYVVYYGSKAHPRHSRAVFPTFERAQTEFTIQERLGKTVSGERVTTIVTTIVEKL